MDKRTRVLNAMDGLPVDRVPTAFYTHFLTPKEQKDNAVSAQIAWFNECNMDCLCIETDGYMEYPIVNTGSLNDWRGIKVHTKDHPYIAGQLDRAKRIREGIKDGAVFFVVFTPFSTIKHTIGGEELVMDYYHEDPAFVTDVMKVLEEDTFRLMDHLAEETGIDGFFVSLQNAEWWRFDRDEYREYMAPWDMRIIDHANSLLPHGITHMCSWTGLPNQLDLWKDYNYKTVNWSLSIEKDMDFKKARDYFKPGTCLMAGFDTTPRGILYRGSEEEIKDFTKKLLDQAGQKGTILCGDCSAQMDTDRGHIRAVAEASEEYAAENSL